MRSHFLFTQVFICNSFVLQQASPSQTSVNHHSFTLQREGKWSQEVCPRPRQKQKTQMTADTLWCLDDKLIGFQNRVINTPGHVFLPNMLYVLRHLSVSILEEFLYHSNYKRMALYSFKKHNLSHIQALPNFKMNSQTWVFWHQPETETLHSSVLKVHLWHVDNSC